MFLLCLVVLQRSLHVEKCQPDEAGWSLGYVDQVRFMLTLLWDRRTLQDTSVQQPSVCLVLQNHTVYRGALISSFVSTL